MKMRVKRLVCLLMALMLCVSLAGCKELDDMRAHQALLQEDGTLLLNGEKYVPLPYCEDFTPPMGDWELVNVTNPDIPVLLSGFIAMYYYPISEKPLVGDNHIIGDMGQFYCAEEDYAALAARIESGAKMDGMQYTYADFNPTTDMWTEKVVVLTEEQINTVKRVVASVEPVDAYDMYYEDTVSLYWCSADGLFSRSAYDVCYYNGHYAVVDWETDVPQFYEAPKELNASFEAIMRPYMESEKNFDEYYETLW